MTEDILDRIIVTQFLVKFAATILKNLPKKDLGTVTVMTVHDDYAGVLGDFIGVLPAVYLKDDRNFYIVFCLANHSNSLSKIFQLYNNYSVADWKTVISELKGWDFSEIKTMLKKHVSEQLG